MVLFYTDAFDPESAGSWIFFLARVILLACILIVYYILLQALTAIQRQAALEEQAHQSEYILDLQRAQYASLQSHMEEIRRARHDLRQHQNIIQSFLDNGDTAALRDYLRARRDAPGTEPIRNFCENHAMNMLLNHYAGQLAAIGADYEFQMALPETLAVAEPDLCVVVGNLLENALEACAGQAEPYVRAAARLTDGRAVAVVVDNTAPAAPQTDAGGSLLSTKHAGSGIGTQSVRYIAGQYGGTADFRWEDGMFRASVFLTPPSTRTTDSAG